MSDEIPDEVNTELSDQESAIEQSLALLRSKNIKEYHSVLTTAGSLRFPNGVEIVSGIVVAFKNKGVFDGNWIIQKISLHLIDGKLMNEIEFRKCLGAIGKTKIITQPIPLSGSD